MNNIRFLFIIAVIISCSTNNNGSVSENDSTAIIGAIKKDFSPKYDYKSYDRQLDVVQMTVKDSSLKDFLYKCISENLKKGRIKNRNYYPESIVLGHLEEDTIVGNFDGLGVDTLYIESRTCNCKDFLSCKHSEKNEVIKYYLVSKSRRTPPIRLLAADCNPPRIVNEGDLDGNGTSEIGYMGTWTTSQWRSYRILTFHKKGWRYLIDPHDEYLSTSRAFRLSGHDIVERGKKKGTILVHFLPEGLNQSVHDTIVKPSYVLIDDIEE